MTKETRTENTIESDEAIRTRSAQIRTVIPPVDGETFETYAARVQAHFGTERAPTPIASMAQVRRLRGIAAKDAKYTQARFDADLAVTDLATIPERVHPKAGA